MSPMVRCANAIRIGDMAEIRDAFRQMADVNESDGAILLVAITERFADALEFMIENGVRVNERAVEWALMSAQPAMVGLLVNAMGEQSGEKFWVNRRLLLESLERWQCAGRAGVGPEKECLEALASRSSLSEIAAAVEALPKLSKPPALLWFGKLLTSRPSPG